MDPLDSLSGISIWTRSWKSRHLTHDRVQPLADTYWEQDNRQHLFEDPKNFRLGRHDIARWQSPYVREISSGIRYVVRRIIKRILSS
jgi:hypothetical protein